jgi:FSR family fosmidomycin resistance protein-like MFS transporter
VVPAKSAFLVVTMVAAAHAVTHANAALMPILYPAIMSNLHFDYSRLGLLLAVSRVFGQGFQWLAGYLGRIFRRKTLLGFGAIFQGVFQGLTGSCASFAQLTAWQSLNRFSGSAQHPSGNSLILEHVGKKARGRVLAVHFAGGNVGTVFVPLIAAGLLSHLGWRGTAAIFALPGIIVGCLLLLLVQEEKPGGAVVGGKGEKPHLGKETLLVLKNRNMLYVLLTQAIAAGGRGMGILMTFVPLYLSQYLRLNTMYTGILYTAMLVGSIVGPMLAGIISDRVPQRKFVLVTTYLGSTAVTILFVHAPHSAPVLSVVLFVLGCFVYAESPLLQSLAADSTEKLSRDLVFGVFFTFGFGSGALWALLMGFLVNRFGFVPAFYVMAASYAVGSLWIFLLKLGGKPATSTL